MGISDEVKDYNFTPLLLETVGQQVSIQNLETYQYCYEDVFTWM